MKKLIMVLLISTAFGQDYQDTVKVPVESDVDKLRKYYQGKKTVQKLNKIIYIRRSAVPTAKFDKRCERTRSKSPAWLCRAQVGYSEMCFFSSAWGLTRVKCQAYRDQIAINKRYGNPDVFVTDN